MILTLTALLTKLFMRHIDIVTTFEWLVYMRLRLLENCT